MNRTVSALIVVIMLFSLVACTSRESAETDTAAFESSIPLDEAAAYFDEMHAIWDEDAGALWGIALHTPLMFVDPETRHGVSNMPDPSGLLKRQGDVYVGILSDGFRISGAPGVVSYQGYYWSVMPWSLVEDESFQRHAVQVLAHEGFHILQEQVVGEFRMGADSPLLRQMRQILDWRISVLLELSALMTAARTSGDLRIYAIHDALSFRNARRQCHPEAVVAENNFELHEGLAVFTDLMLVKRDMDTRLDFIDMMIENYYQYDNLHAFGYLSGALYALLLEDMEAVWKSGITMGAAGTDLAYLLQQHLGITELTPFEQLNLELYGYAKISQRQRAWLESYIMEEQTAIILFLTGDYSFEFMRELIDLSELEQADMLGWPGDLVVTSANWQFYYHFGDVEARYRTDIFTVITLSLNPHRIVIERTIDPVTGAMTPIEPPEVSTDGSQATGLDWELIITDDNYMIETLQNGLIQIVTRTD